MALDRFTWFGLGVALVGWVVLLTGLGAGTLLLHDGAMVAGFTARQDLVTLAQTLVLSGFALAIIGVLRRGFGALHRFFDAVLERSSAPRPAQAAAVPPEPPVDAEPTVMVPMPTPAPARAPSGRVRGQNYVILANGAVEVETLLGTRVFASLDEARDFIR